MINLFVALALLVAPCNSAIEVQADGTTTVTTTATSTGRKWKERVDRQVDDDDDVDVNVDANNVLPPPGCFDVEDSCPGWASLGECSANPKYMSKKCCISCLPYVSKPLDTLQQHGGLMQNLAGSNEEQARMKTIMQKQIAHLEKLNSEKNDNDDLLSNCQNTHELCVFWASSGECQVNRAWMTTGCAPACASCNLLKYENRCPYDNDAEEAYKAGEMGEMFRGIKVGLYDEAYGPVNFLSEEPDGPWVVTFDNFLSDEECDRLISLGELNDFKRSTDIGKEKFDGEYEKVVSERRTSKNAWCTKNCTNDDVVASVMERIGKVTNTNLNNTEHLQILKYVPGEFYRKHHDYVQGHQDRNCGPRVLTFFLYLSDVEEGGATGFPDLKPGLKVLPKKGKALLWPSVLDSDPHSIDKRTMHEAEDVVKGIKYAANSWIHLKDFRKSHELGC